MPRPASPANSPFNDFLFAYVGEERNGMKLTVLSALARLGLDPWGEADRLSGLGQDAAVKALLAMLNSLPDGDWKTTDVRSIALRLARALPGRGRPAAAAAATAAATPAARGAQVQAPEWRKWLIWIGLAAAAFTALAGMNLSGEPAVDTGGLDTRGQAAVAAMAVPPADPARGG